MLCVSLVRTLIKTQTRSSSRHHGFDKSFLIETNFLFLCPQLLKRLAKTLCVASASAQFYFNMAQSRRRRQKKSTKKCTVKTLEVCSNTKQEKKNNKKWNSRAPLLGWMAARQIASASRASSNVLTSCVYLQRLGEAGTQIKQEKSKHQCNNIHESIPRSHRQAQTALQHERAAKITWWSIFNRG